jgi:hypothetical protein
MSREHYRTTVLQLQPARGLATISVPATFSYSLDDPCAVTLRLWSTDGPDVEWLISRDLLAAGLIGPVGCGDVRLTPHPIMSTHLQLHLSDDERVATLLVDGMWLEDFLAVTYDIVPAGREYAGVDVDAALTQLCEGAA